MSVTRDGDRDTVNVAGDASGAAEAGAMAGKQGFLAWWGEELAGMMPAGWRGRRTVSRDVAIIQEIDGRLVFQSRPGATGRVLAPGGRPPGGVPKGGIVYLLPPDKALRRDRRLPAASRAHIQEIMNLQMASETPFTVDEVYSDSIVTGEFDGSREIMVSQALAPRHVIDELIARLKSDYAIDLSAIDVADATADGGRAGFNLLPPAMRQRTASGQIWSVRLMLLALVGAAIFAGMSWRDLQARRIAVADSLVADAEGGAAGAMQVSTRVSQGIEGIGRLAAAQADALSFLRVYDLAARLLPDGAWLEEFSYERPVAYLTGLSANAATLVEAFESSDMVQGARFASPTVTDPATGAERFRLEVTFKAPGAPAPATPTAGRVQ